MGSMLHGASTTKMSLGSSRAEMREKRIMSLLFFDQVDNIQSSNDVEGAMEILYSTTTSFATADPVSKDPEDIMVLVQYKLS